MERKAITNGNGKWFAQQEYDMEIYQKNYINLSMILRYEKQDRQ